MQAISRDIIDEAKRLYNAGLTFEEVAQITKVHKSTIMRRFKKEGIPSHPRNFNRVGVKNGRWKGGYRYHNGYRKVYIPNDHPLAPYRQSDKTLFEHRLIMMQHLGRPLTPTEQVHHINGVKDDNRLENLQLVVGNHGAGIHLLCADCGSRNLVPVEIQHG